MGDRGFASRYVEQMRLATEMWYEKYFPQEAMDEFRGSSEADIAAGLNLCDLHKTPTMLRIYPGGQWICERCSNIRFRANLHNGTVTFDMTPPDGP